MVPPMVPLQLTQPPVLRIGRRLVRADPGGGGADQCPGGAKSWGKI